MAFTKIVAAGIETSGSLTFSGATIPTGPVLIGTGTSTGTASQPLQVTGGAYVSGRIGIGTTNPNVIGANDNCSVLSLYSNGAANAARSVLELTNPVVQSNNAVLGDIYFTSARTSVTGFTTEWSLIRSILTGSVSSFGYGTAITFHTKSNNGAASFRESARFDSEANFLIGATTPTGTASQPLQVTGGAYVSGSVGIGTTNPTSKLQVVGDTRVSGVVTAFDFYNDAEYPNIRPTLDLAFAETKILDSRITFTRASTATYVNSVGILTTAAVNQPRFDHDPTTGESLGLLVEESRTNSFVRSEEFGTTWTAAGLSSITADAETTPDGAATADTLVETTGVSEVHRVVQNTSITSGSSYTVSAFAKQAQRRYCYLIFIPTSTWDSTSTIAYFDLQTGTIVSTANCTATITAFPDGWYRLTATATATATNAAALIGVGPSSTGGQQTYTGDGSNAITVWGAQFETGSFATSYIPTTTATVTRAADVASITGTNFSSWYNQSAGTVVANVLASQGTRPPVAAASVLGITPSVGFLPGNLIYQNTDSNGAWYTADSGILELVLTINLNPNGNKFAWGLTAGASSVAVKDGATRGSYSWSSIARTGFLIGTENIGFIRWKRITYYPVRLPDAQLQTITL